MKQENKSIAQSLLNQRYSIDEIARLMDASTGHWYYWRKKILKCIESGELMA